MAPGDTPLLWVVGLMAGLYAAVGHGGASGYLAAMAVIGLDPAVMRPAALLMNVGVTSWVMLRNWGIRSPDWRVFLPMILGSTPTAFIGAGLTLDTKAYKVAIALLLIMAASAMIVRARDTEYTVPAPFTAALFMGAVLGFVAGLTGVGGGIYLSPVLLILHWTDMRGSVTLAALFIWTNSLSGLAGYLIHFHSLPAGIPSLFLAALTGGMIGTELAARWLAPRHLRRLLGLVLLLAGIHTLAGL